jgi:hypothetical protein
MTFRDRAIVLQPGEGTTLSLFGDRHVFKAVGEQTEGKWGLVEIHLQASAAGPMAAEFAERVRLNQQKLRADLKPQ